MNSTIHFLVVEKDVQSRENLVNLLQSFGYSKISQITSGDDALRNLERDPTVQFIIMNPQIYLEISESLILWANRRQDKQKVCLLLPVQTRTSIDLGQASEYFSVGTIDPELDRQVLQTRIKRLLLISSLGARSQIVVLSNEAAKMDQILRLFTEIGLERVVQCEAVPSALNFIKSQISTTGMMIFDWDPENTKGIEVLKIIKEDPELMNIPLLMMAYKVSAQSIQLLEASQIRVDDCLILPVGVSELEKRIEVLISRFRFQARVKALLLEARSSFEAGRYQSALAKFEEVLTLHSENEFALRGKADVLARLKDLDRAIVYYEKSMHANPSNIKTVLHLAKALEQKGLASKGIELLEKAVNRISLSPELHFALARLYAQVPDVPKAISAYEKVLMHQPQNEEAKMMLSILKAKRKV